MTALSLPVIDQDVVAAPASAILGTYKRAPLEIVGGRGIELLGADGRTYLDFTSGIGVNALGYGDPGVRQAIAAAADTGVLHSSNLYSTEPGELLAQRLVDKSFASKVFFCNSGAEANEAAFKFARRWARSVRGPRKHEIVALRGGFHGRLFASLAATDRPSYRAPFRPLAPGISICERDLDDLAYALNGDTVAAVIVEPVQGEGGVRVLDADLLRGLRKLTRDREIALIFDEVQCGLGRTGTLFAYEQTRVVPEMVTLAKPLAGGLPMGAVLLAEDVARTIEPGDHATTFGGGPFVASVALHVFDRLADEAMLAHVTEISRWLETRLGELAVGTPRIRAIRGIGFMWGIDVVEPASQVVTRALEAGLLILSAGDYTLRLLPPLAADRQELDAGLTILEGVVS